MDKEIIRQLKNLKVITPDQDFKEGTRRIILSSEIKTKPLLMPRFAFASVLALALIAIVSFNIFNSQSPGIASFDNEEIQRELNVLSSSLEIEEIKYRQNINGTISSALNEISNSKTNHLNESVIESERNSINSIEGNGQEDIDELLNKVIF